MNIRYSDEELLDCVEQIDRLAASVTPWEADFIESMLERGAADFSPNQRAVIERLIEQYLQ